jgi:hypothetical protein
VVHRLRGVAPSGGVGGRDDAGGGGATTDGRGAGAKRGSATARERRRSGVHRGGESLHGDVLGVDSGRCTRDAIGEVAIEKGASPAWIKKSRAVWGSARARETEVAERDTRDPIARDRT